LSDGELDFEWIFSMRSKFSFKMKK
jgi:hypothetical protein